MTASRISPRPKRRLRVWAPEGYAGIDFVEKRLTLVQPSEEVRRHGLSQLQLDPAPRAAQAGRVRRHMQTLDLDGDRKGDQLTAELRHFVELRADRPDAAGDRRGRPRRPGTGRAHPGARAAAPVERTVDGPIGPKAMPAPLGKLFEQEQEAAAKRREKLRPNKNAYGDCRGLFS